MYFTMLCKAETIYCKVETIYRWQEMISCKVTRYLTKKIDNSSNDILFDKSFEVKSR